MYWPEILSKEIQEKLKDPYHVDDMKTPSGQIHIGSLRGVLIHDVIHKQFLKEGKKSEYTYIYNDMDPMNKVPVYLDQKYKEDLGKPLFMIKAPEENKNFAEYFADVFTNAFNTIGAHPTILYSSKMYADGKFNGVIKEALDKVDEIRKVYQEVAGYEKPEGWYPLQVICPKCGKVGTTLVTGWDGTNVDFECKVDLVPWAVGCGYKGQISPFDGNAKLMWKVDWPAHWKVLGINVEGAGKDHSSAGGSRDMAVHLCKMFNIPEPMDIPYEWFLTKEGSKMSTSKGVGMYAKDLIELLPPEVARFLILRTHYNSAILFDPNGDTVPDLYDEFDRCAKNYYMKDEEKIIDAKGNKISKDFDAAKYFEAGLIREYYSETNFLPRFRTLSVLIQMPSIDIYEWAKNEKGSELNDSEKQILEERIHFAKVWLKSYAPEKYLFMYSETLPEETKKLTDSQKQFLKAVVELLENVYKEKEKTADELQFDIYELTKKLGIPSKDAFKAIYICLIGKDNGPKAGWLIKDTGYDKVISRFKALG